MAICKGMGVCRYVRISKHIDIQRYIGVYEDLGRCREGVFSIPFPGSGSFAYPFTLSRTP